MKDQQTFNIVSGRAILSPSTVDIVGRFFRNE